MLDHGGMGVDEISKKTGVSTTTIYRWHTEAHPMHRSKLNRPAGPSRSNRQRKNSEEESRNLVLECLADTEMTIEKISEITNVPQPTVLRWRDESLVTNPSQPDPQRVWDPQIRERALEYLADDKMTVQEISKKLGPGVRTIYRWHREEVAGSIQDLRPVDWDPELRERVFQYYANPNVPVEELSKETGVDAQIIHELRQKCQPIALQDSMPMANQAEPSRRMSMWSPEVRKRVFDYLADREISIHEISRRTRVPPTTITRWKSDSQSAGQTDSPSAVNQSWPDRKATWDSETCNKVFDYLADGRLTIHEISRRTGVPPTTITKWKVDPQSAGLTDSPSVVNQFVPNPKASWGSEIRREVFDYILNGKLTIEETSSRTRVPVATITRWMSGAQMAPGAQGASGVPLKDSSSVEKPYDSKSKAAWNSETRQQVFKSLSNPDMSVRTISKQTGVPETTIKRWRTDRRRYMPNASNRDPT